MFFSLYFHNFVRNGLNVFRSFQMRVGLWPQKNSSLVIFSDIRLNWQVFFSVKSKKFGLWPKKFELNQLKRNKIGAIASASPTCACETVSLVDAATQRRSPIAPFFRAGFDHSTANLGLPWENRQIANKKLRLIDFSAFFEQQDAEMDNVSRLVIFRNSCFVNCCFPSTMS